MIPIPRHILKFIHKQQELLESIPQFPQIPQIDPSIFKAVESLQLIQKQTQFPIEALKSQFTLINSVRSIINSSLQNINIIQIQNSLLPIFSVVREVIEFNKLIDLLESRKLHFPYPYTTRTLMSISNGVRNESDLREDLLNRLRSGEIIDLLNKSAFPKIEFEGKSDVISLVNIIMTSLADPKNKYHLEFIWLFPITEKIIQKFFYDNLIEIKTSLEIIKNRIEIILKESDDLDNSTLMENKEQIDVALESITNIQNSISRIDLGTFLHIIELSLDEWPADKVFQIVSILILSKFVNFRNDVIHGRLLKPKSKHLAIALSLFITILNILLIKNENQPILFELSF